MSTRASSIWNSGWQSGVTQRGIETRPGKGNHRRQLPLSFPATDPSHQFQTTPHSTSHLHRLNSALVVDTLHGNNQQLSGPAQTWPKSPLCCMWSFASAVSRVYCALSPEDSRRADRAAPQRWGRLPQVSCSIRPVLAINIYKAMVLLLPQTPRTRSRLHFSTEFLLAALLISSF